MNSDDCIGALAALPGGIQPGTRIGRAPSHTRRRRAPSSESHGRAKPQLTSLPFSVPSSPPTTTKTSPNKVRLPADLEYGIWKNYFFFFAIGFLHFWYDDIQTLRIDKGTFEHLWQQFATTMAMMGETVDELLRQKVHLSSDLRDKIHLVIEGLLIEARALQEETSMQMKSVDDAKIQDIKRRLVQASRILPTFGEGLSDDQFLDEVDRQEKEYISYRRALAVFSSNRSGHNEDVLRAASEEVVRWEGTVRWTQVWTVIKKETETRTRTWTVSTESTYDPYCCAQERVPPRRALSTEWLGEAKPQPVPSSFSQSAPLAFSATPLAFSNRPKIVSKIRESPNCIIS